MDVLDSLSSIGAWILDQFDSIWALYTGGTILGFPIILWILDRLLHIFDVLKK